MEVSELHAENTVLKTEAQSKITAGDKIEFIPSYLDATVSSHKRIYGIRKNRVESTWNTSRDTSP
jgi:D-serine deaminase-like pyridoxal phosphate-dependent protein